MLIWSATILATTIEASEVDAAMWGVNIAFELLNRIFSFSKIYNKCPSISESKIILKDLINSSESHITIENIQKNVCDYFKINVREMLSQRRSRYLVRPRQIAMHLSKNLLCHLCFPGRIQNVLEHSVKIIKRKAIFEVLIHFSLIFQF